MNNIQKSYFASNSVAVAMLCAVVFACGCERRDGPVIDTKIVRKDDFEFLIIRTKTNWYDEFGVSYWCRSQRTISAPRTNWREIAEPNDYPGQGWRRFRGYANGNA